MGAKRLITAIAALCVGAVPSGCGGSPPADNKTATLELFDAAPAVVSRVTDGDTLRLRGGKRVRLVQIDAPEVGECYARASGKMLARRLPFGTRILIARDPTLDGRDDYGRLLRYVFVFPLNVNVELVREGSAVPYFFRGRRGMYADELLDAARDARRERRGLWGACPGAKLDPNRGALTGPAS